jgi:hypothetical protein
MPLLKFLHHFQLEIPFIIRRTAMKRMAVCIAVLLLSSWAWAGSKTYQATGPVVDVRDDAIVVDKGKEGKWEIAGCVPPFTHMAIFTSGL